MTEKKSLKKDPVNTDLISESEIPPNNDVSISSENIDLTEKAAVLLVEDMVSVTNSKVSQKMSIDSSNDEAKPKNSDFRSDSIQNASVLLVENQPLKGHDSKEEISSNVPVSEESDIKTPESNIPSSSKCPFPNDLDVETKNKQNDILINNSSQRQDSSPNSVLNKENTTHQDPSNQNLSKHRVSNDSFGEFEQATSSLHGLSESISLTRSFSTNSEKIINEISISRQPSISKVQNAIHDILNQFDPLREGANKTPMTGPNVKAEFWVDKAGFNYNTFLTQLRNPAAKPIAKEIKSPRTTDDQAKDKVLREKMNLFRWIKESHLDIPPSAHNSSFIQFARAELIKMNEFKSPRDKMICILNCCTVIFGLLKNVDGNVGADSFLPLLIYVIIVSNPPKLVSNVNYISRFRSPDKLQSEAGYYLTNVLGAIAFIESMDYTCLSISKEEFDRNIELSVWEIESEKKARALARSNSKNKSNNSSSSRGYWGSILVDDQAERASWLLEKGSSIAKSTLEKTNQFVEKIMSDLKTPSSPSPPPDSSSRTIPPDTNQENTSTRVLENSTNWVSTLELVCDMFPSFDKDVCEMVLQGNNGYVTETIEQLLEMSQSEIHQASFPQDLSDTVNENSILCEQENTNEPKSASNVEDEEVDDWRGQWADDSSDEEDLVRRATKLSLDPSASVHPQTTLHPIEVSEVPPFESDQALEIENKIKDVAIKSDTKDSSVKSNGKEKISEEIPSVSTPIIPDTSNDEQIARKLQEEEERNSRI
ncbi:Vacuolar protein sorting-associated protein 9a [Smittium mucronatum]|uniref:Vacuolar protein sorting-associated protein 9a n=1 Tax=Smittium mucronatum TaxID=133383 RepID=A0A1R0GYU5_9FUNG|nr:Vacuolar protein sorting-associated protein 9a [Smittium mucronatum]